MIKLLCVMAPPAAQIWMEPLRRIAPDMAVLLDGADAYDPASIDYAFGFRPPPGAFRPLTGLKAVFSLGAGVDGFLADPDFPRHVPLVRFVDHTMSREMAHYVLLHVLMHHRTQRVLDAAQGDRQWRWGFLPRRTEDTRIGVLGLGEIGTMTAERLRDLDFAVSGWSRTRKSVRVVESFAGDGELGAFLAQSDVLVCLLPLTPATRHILNARTFAQLPKGAFVINAARGGHLVEADLIAALDSGHLSGAVLDVFETEPLPVTNPLWAHSKVTITPHVAATSDLTATSHYVANAIRRHAAGGALENLVDFELGY